MEGPPLAEQQMKNRGPKRWTVIGGITIFILSGALAETREA